MPRQNRAVLTTVDVAHDADVAESTVRWWRKTGRLVPAAVTSRGQALYEPRDVERFLERRRRAAEDRNANLDGASA
jgi:DNA-binding transcriptional MerR regulator